MLDKMEPPTIPDGYGISIAYACLLDIVRSISLAIEGPSTVNFRFRNAVLFQSNFLYSWAMKKFRLTKIE